MPAPAVKADAENAVKLALAFAEFTPEEQECISSKIRKLLDEGKAEDQAQAIAIHT